MAHSSETTQIFKSRNNILALLENQGYDTSSYVGANVADVHSISQANQMDMLMTVPKTGKKDYIKYHETCEIIRPSTAISAPFYRVCSA